MVILAILRHVAKGRQGWKVTARSQLWVYNSENRFVGFFYQFTCRVKRVKGLNEEIWIFSAGQLEIIAPGSGCGAGRDFLRSECTGRLYEKFLLDVRQALQRNPKTAGTILSPEVTQMDLPGYLPNCFIHGDIAGFRVYFNTGSSGAVPPTKDQHLHFAICKGATPTPPII